jgi:hypothetical protein
VFVEPTIQDLNEYAQRCTAERGFTLDKVGISEWEDGKARKSYSPGDNIRFKARNRLPQLPQLVNRCYQYSNLTEISIAGQSAKHVRASRDSLESLSYALKMCRFIRLTSSLLMRKEKILVLHWRSKDYHAKGRYGKLVKKLILDRRIPK